MGAAAIRRMDRMTIKMETAGQGETRAGLIYALTPTLGDDFEEWTHDILVHADRLRGALDSNSLTWAENEAEELSFAVAQMANRARWVCSTVRELLEG